MLCFCSAATGAPLSSPRISDHEALALTTFDFGPDAYIAHNGTNFFIRTGRPIVSLSRIERADKGTSDIVSGKPLLQAAEPPALLMLAIGTGMIAFFRPRKTVHRPGRRRVKIEQRPMAQV